MLARVFPISTDSVRNVLVSVAVLCAAFMAPTPARAELILTLQQVGPPPLAVSGTQTRVDALLRLSGSSATPINTPGFSAILSWAGSSGTATPVTGLYTVNLNTGTALIGAGALTGLGTGYLWNDGTPFPDMNSNSLDGSYQRYVAINADSTAVGPGAFDVVIAKIAFAFAAGQSGQYDFTVNAAAPTYGLIDADNDFNTITMANGGGSLVVVPEPSTVTALVFGGASLFGGKLLSRRRRGRSAGAARPVGLGII